MADRGVGGGLSVLLAGVADQYQGAVLTIEGGFHGGLARSGVAVYGSVHVNGYGAGNMAFGIVGSLTDVNDDVVGVAEDGLGLIGGHILHFDIRRGSGFRLCGGSAGCHGYYHSHSHEHSKELFHCFSPYIYYCYMHIGLLPGHAQLILDATSWLM